MNATSEERICERLIDNEIDSLVLLEPRIVRCCPNLDAFCAAMVGNTSVKRVFVGEMVVQMTTEEQLNQLLEAVGQLTRLQALEVSLPHVNEHKRLTGHTLRRLLDAPCLETLVLWPFVRLDTQQEVDLTAAVVRDKRTLTQLVLYNILLSANNDAPVVLDPLLESLATVPHLDVLQLSAGLRVVVRQGQPQSSPIGVDSLGHLVESAPQLSSLAVRNFGLTNQHCIRLASSMTGHAGPKLLDVRFNAVSDAGFAAFRAMMEKNYRLEWLETDLLDAAMLKEINFLLLLNRAGRYTFLKDTEATRDQCVEVLAGTEEDLDATYFLLRSQPAICDLHG